MTAGDVPAVALLVVVAWVVWQGLDAAAAVLLRLVGRGDEAGGVEQLVDEVRQLRELLDDHGRDLLAEAEDLRGVVEQLRDDERGVDRLDELLEQARRLGVDVPRPGGDR